eukprot:CAMPEP_0177660916 /NCGR_PEP_ID=MMETSP0447-20121125/18342_1 /TAXON_ID=0 /ORGANISM="Stygamoeba regulata, Strain BSH-02190019" /LENGTH=372 /DNA_ID=CAMNT_0019166107 /DNA_START=122 /DNA_END=1239 /DNA_ORIENTATION=-
MCSQVKYVEGTNVVELPYDELEKGADLTESIKHAYGFDGLGLLAVSGVPDLMEKRVRTLPMARKFAMLPDEVKEKTVHKESFYSFGWSHGKEMMKKDTPDWCKGSYYFNPEYNVPFEDEELVRQYPSFCHPNIWPRDDFPDLEHACMDLAAIGGAHSLLVARQCDRYVHSMLPAYPPARLHNVIATSRTSKARLLHYFPLPTEAADAATDGSCDSWCGWHNDHGSLTGLVPAMYLDCATGEEVPCPDPGAGLFIRTRAGEVVRALLPPGCLAFQIGETAQVHSGGLLQATPHCVVGARGEAAANVSRETLAVFMEPRWDEAMDMPAGACEEQMLSGSAARFLPPGVPLLATRWKRDIDFGAFTTATLQSYYY